MISVVCNANICATSQGLDKGNRTKKNKSQRHQCSRHYIDGGNKEAEKNGLLGVSKYLKAPSE